MDCRMLKKAAPPRRVILRSPSADPSADGKNLRIVFKVNSAKE